MTQKLRPDQLEELLHQLNQPKLAHVLRDDADYGDDPDESQEW